MSVTLCIVVISLAFSPSTLGGTAGGPGSASPISVQTGPGAPSSELGNQLNRHGLPAVLATNGLERTGVVLMPSSDEELRGGLEANSSTSSCNANGEYAAAEPHSQSELDALLNGYLVDCGDKLFSALDEIYEREERNEGWASELEEKINKLTSGLAHMRVKGECHYSLCRFNFETSSPEGCSRLGHDVDRPLIDSVRGTELQISALYRGTPTGCIRYFYSTVIPPAFLEPLRRRMAGGPSQSPVRSSLNE